MKRNLTEDSPESESALKVLDSLLKDPGQKKISENQIVIILDALASSDDTEVVARFPAVLAICARRGLALNSGIILPLLGNQPQKTKFGKIATDQ